MNNFDLEYSQRQGLFHWGFKDEGIKSGWSKIATNVPQDILIEFHEHMEKKYKLPSKAKHGNFPLSIFEAKNEFANYKKTFCPKERVALIEIIGYNSFTDKISI